MYTINVNCSMDAIRLADAKVLAQNSPDRSTKVGCVITESDGYVITKGFNRMPKGINDTIDARHERPVKYSWFEHAERVAIFDAARRGISLEGSTLYCGSTLAGPPCAECCRALIEAGIKRVVGSIGDDDPNTWEARWRDSMMVSLEMLKEAGIQFDTV
jgi:dCMP deaminase